MVTLLTLHSTMFLLILIPGCHLQTVPAFTFHYFSINTHRSRLLMCVELVTLHSTMFLLIPDEAGVPVPEVLSFTFHYVSINTDHPAETGNWRKLYIPLCFY